MDVLSAYQRGSGFFQRTLRLMDIGCSVFCREDFDRAASRLKVRVLRPSEPLEGDEALYCPSQELEAAAFVIECPAVEGQGRARFDVLAGFLNSRDD